MCEKCRPGCTFPSCRCSYDEHDPHHGCEGWKRRDSEQRRAVESSPAPSDGGLCGLPCPNCEDGAVLSLVCCRMYRETGECCNQPDREDVACETCGGSGVVCPKCRGTGDQRVVAGEDTDDACRTCGGTGEGDVYFPHVQAPCLDCGGTGEDGRSPAQSETPQCP